MKSLYLAGKISGDPNYGEKFGGAAKLLGDYYFVANPADLNIPPAPKYWTMAMKKAIHMMTGCDGIAYFEDYRDSRGAKIEMRIAEEIGMPCKPIQDWLYEGKMAKAVRESEGVESCI